MPTPSFQHIRRACADWHMTCPRRIPRDAAVCTRHEEALNVLVDTQNWIEPDAHVFTATLSACSNGGQWQIALDLLDEMRKRGLQPTVATQSAALSACAKGPRCDQPWSVSPGSPWPASSHSSQQILLQFASLTKMGQVECRPFLLEVKYRGFR